MYIKEIKRKVYYSMCNLQSVKLQLHQHQCIHLFRILGILVYSIGVYFGTDEIFWKAQGVSQNTDDE